MPWAAPSAVSIIEHQLPLEVMDGQPLVTRLLQNYPDPFNPETWIPYELADGVRVTKVDPLSRPKCNKNK